jgi:hypothetical protein
MSSPHYAASRASERAQRMALSVSRRWPPRSCVRSRSKQRASTAWHKTRDRHFSPKPGARITCRRRSRLRRSPKPFVLPTLTS